jgi:hypothetical protein
MTNRDRKFKTEVEKTIDDMQEIIERIGTHHDSAPGYMGIGMAWVLGVECLLFGFIAGFIRP